MKYYFISYSYVKGGVLRNTNTIISEHPLDWQLMVNNDTSDEEKLLGWQEISEEEFNKYYGWID